MHASLLHLRLAVSSCHRPCNMNQLFALSHDNARKTHGFHFHAFIYSVQEQKSIPHPQLPPLSVYNHNLLGGGFLALFSCVRVSGWGRGESPQP